MSKTTKIYAIKEDFAKRKGIPTLLPATKMRETDKAVLLQSPKGHNWWIPKICIIKEKPIPPEVAPEFILSMDNPAVPPQSQESISPERTAVLESNGKTVKITFTFNHEDIQRVKTLDRRKFHKKDGKAWWTAPLKIETVEKLKEWGFALNDKLEEFLSNSHVDITKIEEIEIPGLRGKLRPFQKKGVAFIEAKNGKALIGDEMGLGKTIQALAWLQLHPEKRPAVIICPASLKLNWKKEAKTWLKDPDIHILSGKRPYSIPYKDILIINYDILADWVEKLKTMNPQVLIADECHLVKNNKTKRTKAIKKLAKTIPHIICLSGTPIVNRPIELYNAITLVDSTVVPSYWHYAQRYCGARHNGFGWDFTGASNTEELHEILTSTIMIRRTKKEVLQELPDKIYTIIPVELDNHNEYTYAENDFISWIAENKGEKAAEKAGNAETLAKIETLKQIAVRGKLKQAVEWIKNFLETNEKLIVFAVHKFVIDTLMKEFKDTAVKVDGSVTGKKRQEAVDRFQTDGTVRLFVGNIQAAGVGLTLTAASSVAFLELPWTPGELTQAEDRCHRIGQKNVVNVYYLLGTETIEEKIARMLDSKRKVLDAVLDGKETEEESLLSALINEYKEGGKDS